MSDSSDAEKTEEATQHKKDEAREEGRIPKSNELTVALLLLGSAIVLNTAGRSLTSTVFHISGDVLANVGTMQIDAGSATVLLRDIGWRVVAAIGLFISAMGGIALSVTALQARGVLSLKPLGPDFSRLSPMGGAKKLLSSQALIDLFKSIAKLAIIGSVVYTALRACMPDALRLAQLPPMALLPMVRQYSIQLLISAGLAYLVLAGADYLWQWWSFQKDLRMSKDEVKQESKQQEGDPHVKGRRRQIARSYARRQMLKDVPKADVVIVNPTHIAIALRYDLALAPAPIVLAVGQRLVAERIKAIAIASGVPIVQNIPVARALVKNAKVGTMIPVELYLAVAEILAYVLKTRASRGSWIGSATA